MSFRGDAWLAASSAVQIILAACLMTLSVLGFLASILGSMLWFGILLAGKASWGNLLLGALVPLAACICVRNVAALTSNWVEMEWRPIVEVLLISIASLIVAKVIFTFSGAFG